MKREYLFFGYVRKLTINQVSQLLTPLLLAKSWNVTSMIRTAEQKTTIEKLGQGHPGKLSVLVSSVADVKTEVDAKKILDQVKPDWVVWSAGMLWCMLFYNSTILKSKRVFKLPDEPRRLIITRRWRQRRGGDDLCHRP